SATNFSLFTSSSQHAEPERMRSSMESNYQIELQNVTKTYPGTDEQTIKGIDLSIQRGEFMTFLGGSGAGKTTTLNMIAGFEAISSGKILLDGNDISQLPPYRRNLGMVFQ